MQKVTIGRIVEFHPNGSEEHKLPNNMESAPAIVTQVFGDCANLTLFTANPSGEPTKQMWSVQHKDNAGTGPGQSYWEWLPRV